MEKNYKGTKGDMYHKKIIQKILDEGCLDQDPRSKYADGTAAHNLVFLYLIAKELTRRGLNVKPGRFTWFYDNIQTYDRHFDQAHELLNIEPIECSPTITIDDDVIWETVMPENVHVNGYQMAEIKEINPQLKFDLGV